MGITDHDIEVGDFVLFDDLTSGTQKTRFGWVVRAMAAAEATAFGFTGWVIVTDAEVEVEAGGVLTDAAHVLALVKSNRVVADDLGPLIRPPIPNPLP